MDRLAAIHFCVAGRVLLREFETHHRADDAGPAAPYDGI
jgi:hypothetical protein